MILKGNQRAGGNQLAAHLLNDRDNEHVTVHELRGFMADDLHGALNEAYAVSRGTRCKQFLFSLSLNPPQIENVSVDVFESAIADIEDKLGLSDQPRAIVFHEKEGRRHAHCVWSRIDVDEMKAINLPHYKLKLRDISRKLYLQHQWKMPRGLANSKERDPLNFTLEEWQQAKRTRVDVKKVKEVIQDAWAISDSAQAFSHALRERGFWLARGDRRGHIALDVNGNAYAIARAVGIKSKAVRARLGGADNLPNVSTVASEINVAIQQKLTGFIEARQYQAAENDEAFQTKRRKLVEQQRQARQALSRSQEERRILENKARAARLPSGLKALWFRVTGQYQRTKLQNELEAEACDARDRAELAELVQRQLQERRQMRSEVTASKSYHAEQLKALFEEIAARRLSTDQPSREYKEETHKQRARSPKRTRAP